MKNLQTLISSKNKYSFQVLDSLKVEVEVTDNPYELKPEDLFTMAARINKKRSFLFVSKVLGKHLPIEPDRGLLIGALLGLRYQEVLGKENPSIKSRLLEQFNSNEIQSKPYDFIAGDFGPVVIGFAETATALGHAFFNCFQKGDFFHTTREQLINEDPVITFEEEHSHATSHRCYIPEGILKNDREIILVDDEVTTGKTALNIIRSIHSRFPRNRYTLISILDWRSKEDKHLFELLEHELDIQIKCISLLSGEFTFEGTSSDKIVEGGMLELSENEPLISSEIIQLDREFPDFFAKKETISVTLDGSTSNLPLIHETGRFGLNALTNRNTDQNLIEVGKYLKAKRRGTRTLCLGTGEFMYLPMRIASEMGKGVFYQSTTRSPVHIVNKEEYGARYGLTFPNPEDRNIQHFVYNIPPFGYDDVFLFFEREVPIESITPLLKELASKKINNISIVFFTGKDEGLEDA